MWTEKGGGRSTYGISVNTVFDESRELLFVAFLILLNQESHVLCNVQAQDVFAVDLCIELLALSIIPWEPLGA